MRIAKHSRIMMALAATVLSQSVYAISSSDLNQSISIGYGTVQQVQAQKVDSNAGKGALMGGLIGAVAGSHNRGKGAAIGAVSGGILTGVLQGNRMASSYTVGMTTGEEKVIVTEQADIVVGDCVAIEEGRSANIRRVPSVHCDHPAHQAMSDERVRAKASNSASE